MAQEITEGLFSSLLQINFMLFVAKFFSFWHKDTQTLRTNNKIKFFMSL